MSTPEWSKLMTAPWGQFTNSAKELKQDALQEYRVETERFWNTTCQCAGEQEKHLRKYCKASRYHN